MDFIAAFVIIITTIPHVARASSFWLIGIVINSVVGSFLLK